MRKGVRIDVSSAILIQVQGSIHLKIWLSLWEDRYINQQGLIVHRSGFNNENNKNEKKTLKLKS